MSEALDSVGDAGLNGVRPADETAHFTAVAEAIRAKEMRRSAREFLKSLGLVIAVPLIASGWVARELLPEMVERIEYVPLMADGTVGSAHRWENLPAQLRTDVAINTLWGYVALRESYSMTGAEYAYRIVSHMSADNVRAEYQAGHHPRYPTSPVNVLRDKARIEVNFDSYFPLCMMADCKEDQVPNAYQFRFVRREVTDGRMSCKQYVARVRFTRDNPDADPRERLTFNPIAARVVEYVPGQPVGATTDIACP